MSIPIGWPEAQRICDIPEVREALDKFAADAHEENMLTMVSAIMGARLPLTVPVEPPHWSVTVEVDGDPILTISDQHCSGKDFTSMDTHCVEKAALNLLGFIGKSPAFTQGRAAGLEEYSAIPEEVKKALDRMCKPLHDSVLSGATAAADAYCMEVIRNYVMSTVSPTSSDAGKDDAEPGGRHYRKKPVVIEAIQYLDDGESIVNVLCFLMPEASVVEHSLIDAIKRQGFIPLQTLEGEIRATPGDWIIKGIKGEFYPCKPDIFAATYEPVAALSSLEVIGKGEKG